MSQRRVVHLSASGVSVIVTQDDDRLPVIAYWGAAVPVSAGEFGEFAAADERPGIGGDSDVPYVLSVLPEAVLGWGGRPGLAVHRAGSAWAPRMRVETVEASASGAEPRALGPGQQIDLGAGTVVLSASDSWAGIQARIEIELLPAGLLRARTTVRNVAADAEPLEVSGVSMALPVPVRAAELLDFAGRWGTERIPQRHRITHGVHARESRRGRTGLDATMMLAVGTTGFSSRDGEVWTQHVGIGGNHEHALERGDGVQAFRGGELLLAGEVRLGAGEEYTSPWVHGSWGEGLDAAAERFHRALRDISRSSLRPRPVTLNVWEAVYFEQSFEVLEELAERAAAVGIERFVLDDGWFLGRRDDRRGLGDWSADPEVWPHGLGPLADRVRELGMEFGLWFEPEMINEDSELARAHPDWILRARPELPPRTRFQQVLDLTNPEAFRHILDTLDDLITRWDIAYLKWDHNRDLVAAGHPATGAPAVHDQTLAVYALLDELRRRHPALEIESCASGGGRVDLGILSRTDRIHPSDNHDPIERARILRWTGLLVPPEMMGSHIASRVSHATGRAHDLHTRCALAFIGHFGIEWDLREATDEERAALIRWIGAYRDVRQTIATGSVVTDGSFDPGSHTVRGVVAHDRSEAVYSVLTPAVSADTRTRLRLHGLDPARRYRLEVAAPSGLWGMHVPAWISGAPWLCEGDSADPALSGALLARAGLELPHPVADRAYVVRAVAVG